jgi:DNA-binding CsgD family transcriptional regulator
LFEESLALFRAIGDRQRVARSFHNLGLLAIEDGALEQSAALLAESLALFRQVEHRLGIADVLNDLGWLELARGDPTAAANRFAEGLTIFNAMGSLRGVGRVLDGCACLAAGSQPVLALRLAGSASVLRERTSSVLFPGEETRLERCLRVARQAVAQPAAVGHAGRTMPYEQAVGDAFAFLAEPAPAVETSGPSDPIAKHGLSPRELQVLRLVAEGRSNREIAEALFISRRTATTHMTHLFTKLGLDSRAAAAAYAVRHGIA